MKLQRYIMPAFVTASAAIGLVVAPPAVAECTSAGDTSVCAHGDVRVGEDGNARSAGPVYPDTCYLDRSCDDNRSARGTNGPIGPNDPPGPFGPAGGPFGSSGGPSAPGRLP
jgi:hypothetical protein